MSAELSDEIERLLKAVDQTQQELATLYREKRDAIRRAKIGEVDRLTQEEQALVSSLEAHLRHRHQILQRSGRPARRADSLEALVRSFEPVHRDRLLPQIERARRTAEANRRESWILWIVSQQSARLFGEMLELIANGGRRSPFYSARPELDVSSGGALLDASA